MKQTKLVLIFILVLAFFLRLVNIQNNPPAMYGDELTMALDVNSIIHTGMDETGKFLPLNFSMGGGRPVGYGYFSIPFVFAFGTSELGIRLLSILSGVGLSLLMFFLGKKLFSEKVGLLAAGLLAINPWDMALSRGGFETHFALFLSVLGVVLLLEAVGKRWYYLLSVLCFGLAINTYSTYKLTIPLFAPFLLWFSNFKTQFAKENKLPIILAGLIVVLVGGLLGYQVLFANSESRFLSINAFSKIDLQQQVIQKVNYDINTSSLPLPIAKLFSNKLTEYTGILIESYFKNFSLDFLFLHGDRNPRHNMTTMGQFYLVEIITMLFGLGYLGTKSDKRVLIFLLGWLGLGPIASTLLLETHALRASFMIPPLILISALGFVQIWTIFRNKLFWVKLLVVVGFVIQFLLFSEKLYFVAPNQFGNFWSVAAKKAAETAKQNQNNFDYIILSDRIDNMEFAYPAYAQVKPELIIEQNQHRTDLMSYQFKKSGNVYIGSVPGSDLEKFISLIPGSVLYIGPQGDQINLTNYETVNGKDKQVELVLKRKIK
ncbi:MAG: glycosyltransferase family 39 protein [Candidatus Daviesbacteria bacterium]|nr:glycosyltransferase family 39 protein [Candidatus Daviesbacteria bacterium]